MCFYRKTPFGDPYGWFHSAPKTDRFKTFACAPQKTTKNKLLMVFRKEGEERRKHWNQRLSVFISIKMDFCFNNSKQYKQFSFLALEKPSLFGRIQNVKNFICFSCGRFHSNSIYSERDYFWWCAAMQSSFTEYIVFF